MYLVIEDTKTHDPARRLNEDNGVAKEVVLKGWSVPWAKKLIIGNNKNKEDGRSTGER